MMFGYANYPRRTSAFRVGPPFDLGSYSYENKSFSVTNEEATPRSVAFNSAGTKMYTVGGGASVKQYSLSTAFDVSTASFDSLAFDVSTEAADPREMFFKTDGTKFYILDFTTKKVFQYSVSDTADISTASYDSKEFLVSGQDGTPQGIFVKADGTKFWMCGAANDKVFQYSMSVAFDISTATFDSKEFSVTTQSEQVQQVYFDPAGTRMFIADATIDGDIFQYTLSTAHDVSTASFNKGFDVSSEGNSPTGVFFTDDGEKFFHVSFQNDTVFQYTI